MTQRLSIVDLQDALALSQRLIAGNAVRTPEDLRTVFTLQLLCDELAAVFEDHARAKLPLDGDSRARAASMIIVLARAIAWWKAQTTSIQTGSDEHAGEGRKDTGDTDRGPDHRGPGPVS